MCAHISSKSIRASLFNKYRVAVTEGTGTMKGGRAHRRF